MFKLDLIVRDTLVRRLASDGPRQVRRGFMGAMRKALAEIEDHHKRKEMIRGGGGPPHPEKLTVRTGSLSKSYTRRILEREMAGAYGSDLVYSRAHEFGVPARGLPARPGARRSLDAKEAEIEKILADGAVRDL